MKSRLTPVSFLVLFLCIILLSSFVMLDVFESQNPFIPKALDFVNDNKILSALAVSETAGLFSSKVRGILHAVVVLSKQIWRFFKKVKK